MSHLAGLLEDDLEWRFHEIEIIRRKHSQCANDTERRTVVKCMVLMLYAHWEGFVKYALESYVEALCRSGIPRREFIDNLVARSLQATLNKVSDQSIEARAEFVSEIEKRLGEAFEIEQAGINTKANLKSHVFSDLIRDFGVFKAGYDIEPMTLDTLVDRRNDIAHGKRSPLEELDTFLATYAHVRSLMETLAVEVDECVRQRAFLRPEARSRNP
ncbi:MAG: MAE_28990/MAE_18760 family HEPN-like nuclease [Phycisphaerales bacterium]